jgi:predicted ATPase
MGKTALLSALAAAVEPAGTRVRWARGEGARSSPPFSLWSEIVWAELADLTDPELGRLPSRVLSHLVRLAPDLARRVPGLAPPLGPGDPDARPALLEAMLTLLRERSTGAGLVLALDDLHAADEGSLALLKAVTARLRDSHVVVVVAYRDADARRSPALHRTMSELARQGRRIALAGLDEEGVGVLLERATGYGGWEGAARAVHDSTDGNPLFVHEVGRLLASGGSTLQRLPSDLPSAVGARLDCLSEDTRAVLAAAAVLTGIPPAR